MLTEDDFAYLADKPQPTPVPEAPRPQAATTNTAPVKATAQKQAALPAQLVDQIFTAAQDNGVDPAMLYSVAKDTGTKDYSGLAAQMNAAIKHADGNVLPGLALLYAGTDADPATKIEAYRRALKTSMGADVGAFRSTAAKYDAKLSQYQAVARQYVDRVAAGEDSKVVGATLLNQHGFGADDLYLLNKQVRKFGEQKIGELNAVANLPREVDNLAGRYPPVVAKTGRDIRADLGATLLQGVVELGKQVPGALDVVGGQGRSIDDFARELRNSKSRRTSVGKIGAGPSGHLPEINAPEPTLLNTVAGKAPVSALVDKTLHLSEIQDDLEAVKSPQLTEQKATFARRSNITDKVKYALENPAVIADAAVGSLPATLVGARLAGAGLKGMSGKKLVEEAVKRSALVEGAQTAASANYDYAKDGTLTAKERLAATAAGALTGLTSLGVGKVMPGGDTDALLAQMLAGNKKQVLSPKQAAAELVKKTAASTVENAAEEAIQSPQERMWANFAKGKSIAEGAVDDAVLGALSGAAMGAAGGAANVAATTKVGKPASQAQAADDIMAEIDAVFAGKHEAVTNPLALPEPADAKFARQNPEIIANAKAKKSAAKDVQALNKNQQALLPEPKEVTAAKSLPDFTAVSDDQLKYLATQHPDPAVREQVLNVWEARKLSPENFTLGEKLDVGAPEAAPELQVDTSKNLDLFAPENAPSQGGVEQKDLIDGWQPAKAVEQTTPEQTAPERNPNQGELDLGTRRKADWQKQAAPEQTAPAQQVETQLTPDLEENRRMANERANIMAMPVKEAMTALGVPLAAQTAVLRRAQATNVQTGRDLLNAFTSDSHELSQSNLQNAPAKWASQLGSALEEKLNQWQYLDQQQQQQQTARRESAPADRALPGSSLSLKEGQKIRQAPKTPGVFQITEPKAKPAAKVEVKPASEMTTEEALVPSQYSQLIQKPKLSVNETPEIEHQTLAADIENALRSHPVLGNVLGKLLDAGHINIGKALAENPKAAGSDEGGKINLYTSRLPVSHAVPVAVHEAVHTALRQHIGEAATNRLFARLTAMESAARTGTGEVSQFFKEAAKRIPANTPDEHRGEELGAYAVQKVAEGKAPKGIVAWVKDLIAKINASLIKATNGRIGRLDERTLHTLAIQALHGWAEKAQAANESQQPAKASVTDPAREAQQWQDVWQNDAGPEYYGNGFALIATHDYGVVDSDFVDTPKGAPEWLLGHAATVNPDNRVVAFHIAERNGRPAGSMIAEVDPSGNIEAIHDLQILPEMRNSGLGSTIVKQIAANAPGDVRILEAKNADAQRFWSRNGAGYYDIYKNSSFSWGSHQAAGQRGANVSGMEADTGTAGTNEGPVKYSETEDSTDPKTLTNDDLHDMAKPSVLAKLLELFDARQAAYHIESFRTFVANNAKHLPSLPSWHNALVARDVATNEQIQLGSEVVAQVNDLGSERAGVLLKLMQEESFNGVFASRELKANATEAEKIAHMRLAAQYAKLSDEEKAAYKATRDALDQQWAKIHQALRSITISTIHDPARQREVLRQIDQRYQSTKDSPYFPLQRHGKYFVSGKDYDGEGNNLLASYDTKAQATMVAAELRKRGVKEVREFTRPADDTKYNGDIPSPGLFADLHGAIDTNISDETEKQELHTALQNLYLQALPEFSGAKKMLGRSAKPVLGFDADARRALAVSLFSGAKYAAQLQYAPEINALMRDMTAEARGRTVPYVFIALGEKPTVKVFDSAAKVQAEAAKYATRPDEFTVFDGSKIDIGSAIPARLKDIRAEAEQQADRARIPAKKEAAQKLAKSLSDSNIEALTKSAAEQAENVMDNAPTREPGFSPAQQVLDEAKRRVMPPGPASVDSKIVRAGLTAAYIKYLAFNVSTGVNNLTQTVMISLPYAVGKLGATIAGKQFAKQGAFAAKVVMPHFARETYTAGRASPLAVDNIKGLSENQNKLLKELQSANLLSYTVVSDLMNVVHNTSDAGDRAMRLAGTMNHWAEVWNRVTTGLAAYEGYREKFPTASHEDAVNYAKDLIWKTHGDYSAMNAPPIMNAQRHPYLVLATQFGKYPHAMLEMLWGLTKQMFGSDKAARLEAMKAVAGLYGIGALVGGPLAAPLMATFAFAAQALVNANRDKDDDKFDIRQWWAQLWQQQDVPDWVKDVAIGGLVRAAFQSDTTGRIGTGDILPVVKLGNKAEAPYQPGTQAAQYTQALETLLGGASFAALNSFVKGGTMLAQDYDNPMLDGTAKLRGLKHMLPNSIAYMFKGNEMARKGLVDSKDASIIKPEELGWWGVVLQSTGYMPKQVVDYYVDLHKLTADANKVERRVEGLAKQYVATELAGDKAAQAKVLQEIERFYVKNPYAPQVGEKVGTLLTAKVKDQAMRDVTEGKAANRAQMKQVLNSQYHQNR